MQNDLTFLKFPCFCRGVTQPPIWSGTALDVTPSTQRLLSPTWENTSFWRGDCPSTTSQWPSQSEPQPFNNSLAQLLNVLLQLLYFVILGWTCVGERRVTASATGERRDSPMSAAPAWSTRGWRRSTPWPSLKTREDSRASLSPPTNWDTCKDLLLFTVFFLLIRFLRLDRLDRTLNGFYSVFHSFRSGL